MIESYNALAMFAQTWGLAYFVGVFLLVTAYAFWPSNRAKFDKAALAPLRED